MPAKSKAQQRLMAMVHAIQQNKMKTRSKKLKDLASQIPEDAAEEFAKTDTKDLPEKIDKESAYMLGALAKFAERDDSSGKNKRFERLKNILRGAAGGALVAAPVGGLVGLAARQPRLGLSILLAPAILGAIAGAGKPTSSESEQTRANKILSGAHRGGLLGLLGGAALGGLAAPYVPAFDNFPDRERTLLTALSAMAGTSVLGGAIGGAMGASDRSGKSDKYEQDARSAKDIIKQRIKSTLAGIGGGAVVNVPMGLVIGHRFGPAAGLLSLAAGSGFGGLIGASRSLDKKPRSRLSNILRGAARGGLFGALTGVPVGTMFALKEKPSVLGAPVSKLLAFMVPVLAQSMLGAGVGGGIGAVERSSSD